MRAFALLHRRSSEFGVVVAQRNDRTWRPGLSRGACAHTRATLVIKMIQSRTTAAKPAPEPTAQPERADTDASLQTERKNTDEVIAEKSDEVESKTDQVVQRERGRADSVLETARKRADEKVNPPASALTPKDLEKERDLEDAQIDQERAAADETLRRERALLAAVLPRERERTDRYLVTERARADEALAHRDDFLGMVSHDVRALVSGMGLTAQLLSARASESAEGQRTVEGMKRIMRYLVRMDRLVGDLVDVVSIDAGTLAIKKERGDIAKLLAEVEAMFAPAASDKGVSFTVDVVEGTLLAEFDHDRILQVVSNLIGNALKFTPQGGTVSCCAERNDGVLHLWVKDTGVGIAQDMFAAIFERFWHNEGAQQRGLGLGLYICRSIVDAHGGKIWVESVVGKGSVFHFTIPAQLDVAA